MASEQLSIRVHVEDEEAIVIAPIGEMDAFTSPVVRQVIDELLSYEPSDVVIDLSRVDFLGGSGLGVLVDAGKRLESHGGRLTIRGATEFQYMTLRLVRAGQVARLVP